MSTKRDAMYQRITQHGKNLIMLFNLSRDTDPIELCRKLRTLEARIYRVTLKSCNEGIPEAEEDKASEQTLNAVDKLLNFRAQNIPVFINWDPRGYALKIKDDWTREHALQLHADWGGYGIIAPDLSEHN